MRLTCPNCGAEYEVPHDAIPDSGRDVQCSNCGHTWFETGAAGPAESAPEPDLPEIPPVAAASRTAPPAEEAPSEDTADPAPPDRTADAPLPDPDAPRPGLPEPDPDAPHPDPGQPAPRRRLDPAVASVLQEERDTSAALRRTAPAGPMERQEDLPLTERPKPPRDASDPPRRERLPDVDDINRRLEEAGPPLATDRTPAEEDALKYRKGFRYGFGIVALIAAAAALIYLFAPAIAEAVPATAPPLSAYTGAVDTLRLSLDSSVEALTGRLSGDDPG